MDRKLLTKAVFARLAGVSRSAVTQATLNSLKNAVVGNRIDASHVDAVKYFERKKTDLVTKGESKTEAKGIGNTVRVREDQGDKREIRVTGTQDQLKGVLELEELKNRKMWSEIRLNEIKIAREENALIERALVQKSFINPVETAHSQLLQDGSKTIARRASAMARGDYQAEEIEEFVVDQISSYLKPLKRNIMRKVRELEDERALITEVV